MRKDTVSKERMLSEAKFIQAAFEKAKLTNQELTQESIAHEFGVTQGLVGQWFSGKTNVPDKRLYALSKMLDFDASELRPALSAYSSKMVKKDSPLYELAEQCRELGIEDQAEVILRGVIATAQAKKLP